MEVATAHHPQGAADVASPRARGVSTAREMAQLVKCSFCNQCLPRFHPQNPHFRKNRGPEK